MDGDLQKFLRKWGGVVRRQARQAAAEVGEGGDGGAGGWGG